MLICKQDKQPVEFIPWFTFVFSERFMDQTQASFETYRMGWNPFSPISYDPEYKDYKRYHPHGITLRVLLINLDCFDEEKPIVGLHSFFPIPIKGAAYDHCMETDGYVDYGYPTGKQLCLFMKLHRSEKMDQGIQIIEYVPEPFRSMLDHPSYAVLAFDAEKEFTVSMLYQNQDGMIENLFTYQY